METLAQKAQRLGIKPAGQPTASSTVPQGETLAQKAQRLGIKPANPANPTTPPAPTYPIPQSFSLDLGKTQNPNTGTTAQTTAPTIDSAVNVPKPTDFTPQRGLFARISDAWKARDTQYAQEAKDTTQNSNVTASAWIAKNTGKVADVINEGVSSLPYVKPVFNVIGDVAQKTLNPVIDTLAETPTFSEGAGTLVLNPDGTTDYVHTDTKQLEGGLKIVTNAGETANNLLVIKGGVDAGKGLYNVTKPVVQKATSAINPAIDKAKARAIDKLEQTYTDISSGTTAGKRKVDALTSKTQALNNAGTEGKTPMRTLAESGVIPESSGTKLDTYDQAQEYRTTIKPLQDANKMALNEVGLSSAPVSIDELERRAIEYARTPKNVDSGRFDAMEMEIKKEFALLRKNYPSGQFTLGKLDDVKSARWDNVFKNKSVIESDALKKDSEYAIAKSMQKTIEDVARQAGHEDVAQLNRLIGDKLEASRFLEDLNGKTLKGGRLLKYSTTLIGSGLGSSPLGKILGAIGGNAVGDLIIASNVASPVKRILLKNLEATDPQAYTRTIEWLKTQNLDRETRLLLPAPSGASTINDGRAIPVFPKGTDSKVTEYLGKDTAIYPTQSKSPNSQQTIPAITSDNSIPPTVLPPTSKATPKSTPLGKAWTGTGSLKPSKVTNTSTSKKLTAKEGVSGQSAGTSGGFDTSKLFAPTKTSKDVSISDLTSVKDTSASTIAETERRFGEASLGKLAPRKPISVVTLSDGKKLVVDGNGTVATLKKRGYKGTIPTEEIKFTNLEIKPTDEQIKWAVKLHQQAGERVKDYDKLIGKMSNDLGVEQLTPEVLTYKTKTVEGIIKKKFQTEDKYVNDSVRDTVFAHQSDVPRIQKWLEDHGAKPFNTDVRDGMKNRFLTAKTGYRDANFQFTLGNDPHVYELQIMGKNMAEAKNQIGHVFYDLVDKDKKYLEKNGLLTDQLKKDFAEFEKISNDVYDIAYDADTRGASIPIPFKTILLKKEKDAIKNAIPDFKSKNLDESSKNLESLI